MASKIRPKECHLITVVARLNTENHVFKDLFVIPPIRCCKYIIVTESDPRHTSGKRVLDPAEFLAAVQKMSARSFFLSDPCVAAPRLLTAGVG
jgi:hypothetical protein